MLSVKGMDAEAVGDTQFLIALPALGFDRLVINAQSAMSIVRHYKALGA